MRTWLAQELPSDVPGAGVPHPLLTSAEAEIARVIALLAQPAPRDRVAPALADTATDAAATSAMGGDWESAVRHLQRIASPPATSTAGSGGGGHAHAEPGGGSGPERWDADHVWRSLAGASGDGLGSVATGLGLTRHAAIDHVHGLVEQERREYRPGWLARHWLDAALLLGLTAILALALVDVQRARIRPAPHELRSTRALHAYQALAPGDVRATGPHSAQRRALMQGAEHRYLLHSVPAGAVLADSILGPAAAGSLAGRSALALTLRPAAAAQQLTRGDHATLLVSPEAGGVGDTRGLVLRDVPVLDRAVQGDSVATLVVAVPDSLLAELAARLGAGSVHLLPSTAP
ncbi:MAG TPA: hypothetical protein VFH27_18180 [Longimicrobiaceae bacterium]|nr:hypothetical protein [Longimicrobiaceae bacterium]